ncbi:hypothetical protein VF13_25440, partial [Nostoc linckia z16]
MFYYLGIGHWAWSMGHGAWGLVILRVPASPRLPHTSAPLSTSLPIPPLQIAHTSFWYTINLIMSYAAVYRLHVLLFGHWALGMEHGAWGMGIGYSPSPRVPASPPYFGSAQYKSPHP